MLILGYGAIGRGNVTDEAALVEVPQSKKIVGVLLDVTAHWPWITKKFFSL
jgi:phosphoglycerate dehydrogenase-like enzyme